MLAFDVMAFFWDIYSFFARHARSWNRYHIFDPFTYKLLIDKGYVQLSLCVRSFVAEISHQTITSNRLSGFQCKRESRTLSLCGTTLSFTERRYSLAVNAKINTEDCQPIYPLGAFIIIDVHDPRPFDGGPVLKRFLSSKTLSPSNLLITTPALWSFRGRLGN